ncbi:hypothetical protein [Streptomyces bullii]|uniref:Halobacterial output domain-containing protein n=1 Tax=Streptomyces bullii TaxID=349910 RepID=A0ABW0US56_9ACTN
MFTVQVTETATYEVPISDEQAAELLGGLFRDDPDLIAEYLDTSQHFTAVTDRDISSVETESRP